MRCVRWVGEHCGCEGARRVGDSTWRVSDQEALRVHLTHLEQHLLEWSALSGATNSLIATELRAAHARLDDLREAFFGHLVDLAKVIRGGLTSTDQLRRGISEHLGVPGLVGFSVSSENELSIEVLAEAARYPNRQISYADVRALRALGSNVVPSPGRAHHCTVIADVDQAEQLSAAFGHMPNPHRRGS